MSTLVRRVAAHSAVFIVTADESRFAADAFDLIAGKLAHCLAAHSEQEIETLRDQLLVTGQLNGSEFDKLADCKKFSNTLANLPVQNAELLHIAVQSLDPFIDRNVSHPPAAMRAII